jgi:Uma2 family endonuclease
MSAVVPTPEWVTAADLLERLGGVAPERLRLRPAPGTATEQHLLEIMDRENRLYELVEGVLVEKVMGYPESALAAWIIHLLQGHVHAHDLGCIAGESGATRLLPGLVRIPDVSFVSWGRLGRRKIPQEAILGVAPDLAVEVLSPGNTRQEMAQKIREYFLGGALQVWLVDPRKRYVDVWTAPDQKSRRTEEHSLDGGDVLPGLDLPVRKVFEPLTKKRPRPRP